jgi:hypothetical protein
LRHVFVAVDVRNLRQQTDGGKQPRVAANTRQDASARARKKTNWIIKGHTAGGYYLEHL